MHFFQHFVIKGRKKMDWTSMKFVLQLKPSVTYQFERTKKIQRDYDVRKDMLKACSKTMKEFILKEYPILHYRCVLIVVNEFPYKLPRDVIHMVIWLSPCLNRIVETRDIERIFQDAELSYLLNRYDMILFRNDSSTKSILEVEHMHLLVKTETPFENIKKIQTCLEKLLSEMGFHV